MSNHTIEVTLNDALSDKQKEKALRLIAKEMRISGEDTLSEDRELNNVAQDHILLLKVNGTKASCVLQDDLRE